jgi:hypothetical protein
VKDSASKEEEQVVLEDGEVVHTGEQVYATDGHIGHVGKLLENPETDELSYLVLEKGHLWGKKEIALPVSTIERFEENTVYLKIDKQEVEARSVIADRQHRVLPRHTHVQVLENNFQESPSMLGANTMTGQATHA